MGVEGSLDIRLEIVPGAANRVRIHASRLVHASRVFNGRSVAESLQLIPRLFSICATAQACAGVRACEQALGLGVSAETEQLRDLLVNMESLREQVWRILLDWPRFTGGQPDRPAVAEVVAMQRDYRSILDPGERLFQPGWAGGQPDAAALSGLVERLSALLQRAVFGIAADHWCRIDGEPGLDRWAATAPTAAAALIGRVMRAGWSGVGACSVPALPALPEGVLRQAMQDSGFIEQPQWLGRCRDASGSARVDSPLLLSLKQQHGNGLLVRLVARLTETARLLERLLPEPVTAASGGSGRPRAHNPGIGQAAAARGPLVHRVELSGDRIAGYRILAPTEWHFHPRGVVVQALSSLQGDGEQVREQAQLLIDAIDPCVGYTLQVCPGSAADV